MKYHIKEEGHKFELVDIFQDNFGLDVGGRY